MTQSDPHIVKAFDNDLRILVSSIGAMGDFALTQFSDAMRALLNSDPDLAERVINQDRQLDALRRDLSATTAAVITRRQPVATDLEEVLADLRVVEDVERIGDLAKNIAKRATAVAGEVFPGEVKRGLEGLAALATEQLKLALETYGKRDAEMALFVRQQDERIDQAHTELFRDLVSRMGGDPGHVVGLVHLLFCAKNIERIGDHATHIAEAAHLAATGQRPVLERRRLDESSITRSTDLPPPKA